MTLVSLIATVGGVGHLRPAPGTWGSLAGLVLGWALASITGWIGLLIGTVIVFYVGRWATDMVTRGTDNHDPSEVVVDEVAGQWVALLPVVIGASMSNSALLDLWPGWIAAFALFRLFDIKKPWIVGHYDRMDTPHGVMMDDICAGAMAAVGVVALAAAAHLVM
ncbi:MAG: phosphatidylglycerophosphatase A [Yoonia sp.]|jgi:phosphatidylglycerophosphatase A|nr:phosphatidylglycerophosphatase A [Yoonia sp.]